MTRFLILILTHLFHVFNNIIMSKLAIDEMRRPTVLIIFSELASTFDFVGKLGSKTV